ncbi:MAG: hypothetical protein QM776_16565 [Rhodocyclaceae bacterium]
MSLFAKGNTMRNAIVFLCSWLLAFSVGACVVPPMLNAKDKESVVIMGEVLAVRLTEREAAYQGSGQRDLLSSATERHKISVAVLNYLQGRGAPEILELEMGGCGVWIPHVLDRGIFVLSRDKKTAVPYYEKEGYRYAKAALVFGLLDEGK